MKDQRTRKDGTPYSQQSKAKRRMASRRRSKAAKNARKAARRRASKTS